MKASYVKTQLKSIINVSEIVTIHYYEFDKNFVFDGETHNFWEMVYVDKGKVLVMREKEQIILSHGEIIFHKPNEFHSIRAFESAPDFFVITFVCNSVAMRYFENYYTVLNKTLSPFIELIIKEAEQSFVIPKNDPMLTKLTKIKDAPAGSEQLIKTYLEQLLIHLIRDMTKSKVNGIFTNKESMENHIVKEIKEYVDTQLYSNIGINAVCRQIGYGKSYLCKLFKEQTGNTIARFVTERKIDAAKRMIREGNLNFTQISDALAFDNPQYFSRVFKRITDMTPSEFKISLNVSKLR